jgi:hypothetical protein
MATGSAPARVTMRAGWSAARINRRPSGAGTARRIRVSASSTAALGCLKRNSTSASYQPRGRNAAVSKSTGGGSTADYGGRGMSPARWGCCVRRQPGRSSTTGGFIPLHATPPSHFGSLGRPDTSGIALLRLPSAGHETSPLDPTGSCRRQPITERMRPRPVPVGRYPGSHAC